ncbi:MAG: beta-lactamase family protein [Proteobacteria bacterium]|nr:beta-lactamase family protein [Pseudomonadota bacterium]
MHLAPSSFVKSRLARLNRSISIPADVSGLVSVSPREGDPAGGGLTEKEVERIWGRVEDLYRTGLHPAAGLCLIRGGRVVLDRTIGHARGNGPEDGPDGKKVLASPETLFCWFSASKAVTAMVVHLLVEDGKIHLLDPVSHYLPEFAVHGKGNVTVQQMLCHRGGIPMIPTGTDPEILYDWDRAVAFLSALKPAHGPGRQVAYHAVTGGYILGEIVRRVTGKELNQVLKERITGPLGLPTFAYGVAKKNMARLAQNHFTGLPVPFPASTIVQRALCLPWERVVDISNQPPFYQSVIPSANLCSTNWEMARFYQMLLNGGELDGVRIFSPLTIRRALMEPGKRYVDRVLLLPIPYSLGLIRGGFPISLFGVNASQAFGHSGFINCISWADPSRDIAVALQNTGKPLLGSHIPALVNLVGSITHNCPRIRSCRQVRRIYEPVAA